jgi:1-deoxy-D-xylulose-5-phosphate synthase
VLSKVVFLNFGALLDKAIEVSEKMDFTLIDMRFVKPLDHEILKKYLSKAEYFVSLEDGSIAGGAGSAIQEFCSMESINVKSILLGIPDRFIEHASREEMLESACLSVTKILDRLKPLLEK